MRWSVCEGKEVRFELAGTKFNQQAATIGSQTCRNKIVKSKAYESSLAKNSPNLEAFTNWGAKIHQSFAAKLAWKRQWGHNNSDNSRELRLLLEK